MKALFFTEGGQTVGFGHITRCCALQKAMKAERVSAGLVVHGDASVRKHFSHQIDRICDWIKPGSMKGFIRNADIVVIDSYLAPLGLYKEVSENVRIPVYIDDFARLPYPKGVVLAGAIGAEKYCNQGKKEHSYLLGTKYILLRKEFCRLPRRNVRKDVRNILITFGGIDRPELIRNLLAHLSGRFHDCSFHVVLSKCSRKFFFNSCKIHIHAGLGAREMKRLMLRCDMAICGGGQTTNELAACGVPMIGVGFAGNQRLNLMGWQKKGVLKYGGDYKDPHLHEKILQLVSSLNPKRRQKMSHAGQRHVDGKGAMRAVNAIMKRGSKK